MSKPSSKTIPDRTALRRTLTILRPHLGRHRVLIIVGLLFLLAESALRILEPWPVKFAVDAVTQALGADLAATTGLGMNTTQTLIACAIGVAVIVGGRAVVNYISTISFAKVGARVATELRSRVFEHVQRLSLAYHSRASIGDTSQRLVGDVGRLQEVAVTAGLPLIGNVVTLGGLLAVVAIMNPLLAVVVVGTGAFYLAISKLITPRITKAARATRKGEGRLVGSAAEALGAIRVVQSYNLQAEVADEFQGGNEKAMKAGVKSRRLAARLERSTDVLIALSQALVLLVGGLQVLKGAITPGDLVLYISYLKLAMRPLRDMAKYTGRIARAAASGERIADLLEEEVDIADPEHPRRMSDTDGTVEFVGLRSHDGHGRQLFEGLDLVIPDGQRIGLLGRSGAGKSTLSAYLLRLMQPEHGRVRIGGRDVSDVKLDDLRDHIAVLLQESVLFSTTVRENVRYGRPDATDAEVEEAVRRAGAHEFVSQLPDGYDTLLGQRGDNLSGGQRQRLAIARALLRRSTVVLLDEPTVGLDPASKAKVVEALSELTRDRTTIMITHEPAALMRLDRVVWLEDGVIVEDGKPEKLAAQPDSRFAQWLASDEAKAQAASDRAALAAAGRAERTTGARGGTAARRRADRVARALAKAGA